MMSNGWQLQPQFQIPADATSFSVVADGTASYMPAGAVNAVQLGRITVATFINPAISTARGENLYLETEASGAPQETDPVRMEPARLSRVMLNHPTSMPQKSWST